MLHGLWHKWCVKPIMLDDGHDGHDVVSCIMLLRLWHKQCVMAILLDDGDDGDDGDDVG